MQNIHNKGLAAKILHSHDLLGRCACVVRGLPRTASRDFFLYSSILSSRTYLIGTYFLPVKGASLLTISRFWRVWGLDSRFGKGWVETIFIPLKRFLFRHLLPWG
jgi:hypothetical protein